MIRREIRSNGSHSKGETHSFTKHSHHTPHQSMHTQAESKHLGPMDWTSKQHNQQRASKMKRIVSLNDLACNVSIQHNTWHSQTKHSQWNRHEAHTWITHRTKP